MAYIRGSQIRPELGRTDYTPFLQGAMQGAQSIQRGVEQGLSTIEKGMQEGAKRKSQEKIMKGTVDATIKELDSIAAVYGQNNIVRTQVESYRNMFNDPNAPLETKFAASQQAQQGIKFLQQFGAAGVEQHVDSQALLAGMEVFNQTGDAHAATNAYFGVNPNGDINRLSTAMNMNLAARNAGDETTALTRKVSQMREAYPDLSNAEAMDLANGFVSVSTNPDTGEIALVNKRTGDARSLDVTSMSDVEAAISLANKPDADSPNSETLWNMANVTGLRNSITNWAQGFTGQVGWNVADPEVQGKRQLMDTATRELIRALSINPRFPVAEMEAIAREVDIKPGAFKDVQTLQAQMSGVDRALRWRLENEARAASDRTLPSSTRQAAAAAVKDLRNFLGILGVPQDMSVGAPTTATPKPAQDDASQLPPAPKGVDRKLWELLTPEERALWK
jgi:hypothetical protein